MGTILRGYTLKESLSVFESVYLSDDEENETDIGITLIFSELCSVILSDTQCRSVKLAETHSITLSNFVRHTFVSLWNSRSVTILRRYKVRLPHRQSIDLRHSLPIIHSHNQIYNRNTFRHTISNFHSDRVKLITLLELESQCQSLQNWDTHSDT